MTGTLPVFAQWLIAVVGIVGGLAILWRILRYVAELAAAVPVVLQIADQFEISSDPRRTVRDPRRVLPILIDIAKEFEPNHGRTLYDRITRINDRIAEIELRLSDIQRRLEAMP